MTKKLAIGSSVYVRDLPDAATADVIGISNDAENAGAWVGVTLDENGDEHEVRGEWPTGTIRIINDPAEKPGKVIGVELDEIKPYAHGLDEKLDKSGKPYKVNGEWATNVEKGRGWWTLPEHIEAI